MDGAYLPTGGGTLTYALPERWVGRIGLGQLVWVPRRKQLVLGVVVALGGADAEPPPYALKALHAPVEPAFRLSEDR